MPVHKHQQLCIYFKQSKKKGEDGGLQRNFRDVDSFIVHKPRGETPEYSLSLRYKRMELSGDGHESKAQLISNPVEGGLPYKMKVLLQTNILTITVYIFLHSPSGCQKRQGREGGEGGVLNGSK